jgi:hypothetical protein
MTSTRFPRPVLVSHILRLAAVALAGCAASSPASSGGNAAASGGSSGSGSSGGSSSGGEPKDVTPCQLTTAEASTITKKTVTSAKKQENNCAYGGSGYNFAIIVEPGASDSDWKAQDSIMKLNSTKPKTINGLGDRAEASSLSLITQAKGYIITIQGADEESDTTYPVSVALAKAVIAKL